MSDARFACMRFNLNNHTHHTTLQTPLIDDTDLFIETDTR